MNARVLVLNRNWCPVDVMSTYDAIAKVFAGRAKFLDVETCAVYDFEGWTENWSDAIRTAKVAADRVIGAPSFRFLLPEVIVCSEYRGFGYRTTHRQPKFSRGNIYRRDRNTCQFCAKKLPTEELTIDHIIPKSKGGKMVWENVVLACGKCNAKKDDKLLSECGMKLIRKPFKPRVEDLKRNPVDRILFKMGRKIPKTWEAFLGKMYWMTELKE